MKVPCVRAGRGAAGQAASYKIQKQGRADTSQYFFVLCYFFSVAYHSNQPRGPRDTPNHSRLSKQHCLQILGSVSYQRVEIEKLYTG